MSTRRGLRGGAKNGVEDPPAEPAEPAAEPAAASARTEEAWAALEATVDEFKKANQLWSERCQVLMTAQQAETAEVKRLRGMLQAAAEKEVTQKKAATDKSNEVKKRAGEVARLQQEILAMAERYKVLQAAQASESAEVKRLRAHVEAPGVGGQGAPAVGYTGEAARLQQELTLIRESYAIMQAAQQAETSEVKRLRSVIQDMKGGKVGAKRKHGGRPFPPKVALIVEKEVELLEGYFKSRCETYATAVQAFHPEAAEDAQQPKFPHGLPADMFNPRAFSTKVVHSYMDRHDL